MAFTTSNVQKSYFGNLKVLVGDWSGTIGDAPGTIQVEGGRVYISEVTAEGAAQPYQIEIPVSTSTSGSVTTVTIYNQNTTSGQFIIIYK